MNTPKLKKTYKERKKKEILLRTIFTRISKSTTNIRIHHFKTTFMCPRSIAGVPSSQALLGSRVARNKAVRDDQGC